MGPGHNVSFYVNLVCEHSFPSLPKSAGFSWSPEIFSFSGTCIVCLYPKLGHIYVVSVGVLQVQLRSRASTCDALIQVYFKYTDGSAVLSKIKLV